jgi:hypothetical protein
MRAARYNSHVTAPLADDTSADIEARQLDAWRRMTPAHKAALVIGASRAADAMARAGIRARFPNASLREQFLRLAVLKLGYELACRAYPEIDRLDPA